MDCVEDHVRFAELLQIYGSLLSARQRECTHLHYVEDLSYGEIAERSNVSRQAVHDAIAHARKALLRFERELALLSHSEQNDFDMDGISRVLKRLDRLASEDILYDTRRLKEAVRDLKALLIQEPASV